MVAVATSLEGLFAVTSGSLTPRTNNFIANVVTTRTDCRTKGDAHVVGAGVKRRGHDGKG
jgi:hypothetical protein